MLTYASVTLDQRKQWYSPAARAYDQTRPHYPQVLIDRTLSHANLSAQSHLLEIGCGPGTATIAYAPHVASLLCLEPNPDFCHLAQHNCQAHPQVQIANWAFEEWPLQPSAFDAVVAASSFHWIPPELAYAKAAQALKPGGSLILFWNKELQPDYATYQALAPVYQRYAPHLDRYETAQDHQRIFEGLGQIIVDSGYFKEIVFDSVKVEVTYAIDQYLMLLTTYSPYLKLSDSTREILFRELREVMESRCGNALNLSFVSAFHLARKI
jgi:SAM-dependent methyltransferase